MFSEMQPHPVATRSSLEAMLDRLSKRENDKTMDLPPPLPSRPLPRPRFPPTKRPSPVHFGPCDQSFADDTINAFLSGQDGKLGFEFGGFCSSKINTVQNGDLECSSVDVAGIRDKQRLEEVGSLSFTDLPLSCPMDCTAEVNSFVNKVIHEKFTKFQLQMSQMETALDAKESKNIILQEQLQRLESMLSQFETKTKAKEEMWQKQMESLQMTVEELEKSRPPSPPPPHVSNNARVGIVGDESSLSMFSPPPPPTPPQCYESGCTSTGTETPVRDTPFGRVEEPREGDRDGRNGLNVVDELVKEFEEQKQVLEKGAEAIIELHSGELQQKVISSGEDLQKLKQRFMVWKKGFKSRLKEAKMRLNKLNHTGDKGLRMLWCRKFPKI